MMKRIINWLAIFIVVSVMVCAVLPSPVYAADPWYDTDWQFRKSITVTNSSADYQTQVRVYYGTGTDVSFDDREPNGAGTYTADAGTSTTKIVDAALAATQNDYYNGCMVYNSTRALWGNVTDYDAASKMITCSTIAGQVDTDVYYLTNIPAAVYLNSLCNADFGDIRFTGSDAATLLDIWQEQKVDSDVAWYWVQNDATPSGTLYIYYGNPTAVYPYLASSNAHGTATFIKFEDFEWGADGTVLSTSGGSLVWTVTGAAPALEEIDTVNKYGGSRSGRLYRDTNSVTARFSHSASTGYAIRYRVYKEDTAQFYQAHGDATDAEFIRVPADEDIEYYGVGPVYVDTTFNEAVNTWELFELNDFTAWDGTPTCDIWFQGAKIVDNADFNNNENAYPNIILFGVNLGTAAAQIDDVIVRKWNAVEPTLGGWGAEEDINGTVIGEGTDIQGTYAGGGLGYWEDMNIGGAGYITSGTINGDYYHSFDFRAFTSGTINSVTLHASAKSTDIANSATLYCLISGTRYFSIQGIGTAYTDISATWVNNPATGVAWTEATLNAAEFGIVLDTYVTTGPPAVNHYERVNYMHLEIDDTADAAPTVTTGAATSITGTTAVFNGNITNSNGVDSTLLGFVWDTLSHPAAPSSTTLPPAGYAIASATAPGPFSVGAYTYSAGALISGTTYYYRFYAYNTSGYGWGEEISFTTLSVPAVNTVAASAVMTTTARINGLVVSDGGELCDIRFAYDTVTHASFSDYANITPWVNDTYTTGQYPYVDITGLTATTTYYFRVQIRNSIGVATGSELVFLTVTSVGAPTNLIAIASGTSISLSWVKGSGAANTMLRASKSAYPTAVTEGSAIYISTGNSYLYSGLDQGTNYYFSAWGMTSGSYSGTYITALATTTAASAGSGSIEVPPANSSWVQTPSTGSLGTIPILSTVAQSASNSFKVPLNMTWYFIWFLLSMLVFAVVYMRFGRHMLITCIVTAMFLGLGVVMKLTMLVIPIFFLVFAAGYGLVKERY